MHIPGNLLVAVARGEEPPEVLEAIEREHAVALCKVCKAAARWAATRAARPGLALPGIPLDPVERARRRLRDPEMRLKEPEVPLREMALRDLEEDAAEWVKACVKFKPAERRKRMEDATKRFTGSLFCALLLAKAREAIPGEPAKSWSLADAALAANERRAKYKPRPDPEVQAPALAVRGNAARALGRVLDAEVDLEAALGLLDHPDLTDPGTPAEVHAYLGSLREDQGQLHEARFHLERAALLYRHLKDSERTARQLLKLGAVYYVTHDAAAAVAVTEEAIALLGPGAEGWLQAYARYNLAFDLHAAGETDRAEAELDTHEELIAGATEQLANLLVWLRARIAWSRKEVRKAQRLFQEARERALARGIPWDAALVGLELALVHLAQGHTRRARTLAEEALPIFAEQRVHRETRATVDLLQAAVRQDALTRGLLEHAIATLERAPRPRPG
jgi:tetratricopeptide (TPR) repeat protein